jgi:hypothetical protein
MRSTAAAKLPGSSSAGSRCAIAAVFGYTSGAASGTRSATPEFGAERAEVVEVDFPVVSNYESDRPGAPSLLTRGLVSREFLTREILDLSAWAWDDFLRANGDPALRALGRCRRRTDLAQVPRRTAGPLASSPDYSFGMPWASSPAARPKDANTSESWNTEFRLMPSAVTVKTWSVCSSYPPPTRR